MAAPPKECAPRSGTYVLTVTPRAPNGCALSPGTVVVNFDSPAADDPTCTNNVTESADHCKTNLTQTCGDGVGKSTSSTWAVTWDADGEGGAGIMTWAYSATLAATPCVSTVAVMYARQ